MIGDGNLFGAIAEIIHNENESVSDLTNIIRLNIVGNQIGGLELDPYMIQYFANTYHCDVYIRFVVPNHIDDHVVRIMDLSSGVVENSPYNIYLDYTGEYYSPAFYAFEINNVDLNLNDLLDYILVEDSSTMLEYFMNAGLIDLYSVDINGNNILHLAVIEGATEIIAVITGEMDFNVEAINNEGYMPSAYAINDFIRSLLVVNKKDPTLYGLAPEPQSAFKNDDDQDPDAGTGQANNNNTIVFVPSNKFSDIGEIYPAIYFYDEFIHHKVDFSGDCYSVAIANAIAVYI